MRTMALLAFWADLVPGGAQTILGTAGIGPDAAETTEGGGEGGPGPHVCIRLAEDDKRLPGLVELLKQHDVYSLHIYYDEYTDEELNQARLLLLKPTRACELDGGTAFGTTHDLSAACPVCGAGAVQNSAMYFDGDESELRNLQGHRAGTTYRDEVFVDEAIAAELEALAPTGLVLHDVYALMPENKQLVKMPYRQLYASHTLPPMSPLTTGLNRPQPCAVCTRSGFTTRGKKPNRIVYRASDLKDAVDVNLTWEGRGYGQIKANPRESWLPVPWLLVTPKVMQVFRNAGVTELEWIPIRVVDE